MLKKTVKLLRGSVRVRAQSVYPERVLNLCSARKLAFWDLEWEGAETFTCRMSRGDHRILSRAAEKLDCTIEIVRREGAPYTLAKLRHRQALAVGIAACGAAVLIGSFFVWDIQIAGNETVPREVILRSLEKNGVHRGCFGFALNGEDIRNHVLLELPDVVWLTVNMRGCTAHVQVVERQRPPHLYTDGEITNVVAARDGLVTGIQALDGEAQVMAGSTVTAGQVLISGVVDSDRRGYRLLHGMGQVWARTWYELSVSVPLTVREKGRETGAVTRLAVDVGRNRIKIYGKGSMTGPDCDKMTLYHQARLPFGLTLPVTLVTERTVRYAAGETERSPEEARAEGEAQLMAQLRTELAQRDGSLLHHRFDAVRQGVWLVVTLHAECEEQIGVSSPLDIQDMGR